MEIAKFIKTGRQTGQTTNLLTLISLKGGLLIVSRAEQKKQLIKQNPSLKDHIFTLYEIKNGKLPGIKSGLPIYFDNTAVIEMANHWEKIFDGQLVPVSEIEEVYESQPSQEDLDTWKMTFSNATNDKNFKITSNNYTIIPNKEHKHQLNVKLTEDDIKDMEQINQDFFEGEASNSMLGRVILRKGISFYQKLKSII